MFNAKAMNSLSTRLLGLLSSGKQSDKLITEIVFLVQQATSIESVGLRLADGGDFPYYFTSGFSQNFIEKEMHLCSRNPSGELVFDPSGNPILECMCGNVICGRTDSSRPFFSVGGSFWSNSTTDLLAKAISQDSHFQTRNRCNREGYESVALIPIKLDGKCYGLLQLNDHRKGMFKIKQIHFLEGVAAHIGLLFLKRWMTDELESHAAGVHRAAGVRGELLVRLANELGTNPVGERANKRETIILAKIATLLAEFETLKGLVHICCECKRVRVDADYWQQVEGYISDRSSARFTHTYCRECFDKEWEKIAQGMREDVETFV